MIVILELTAFEAGEASKRDCLGNAIDWALARGSLDGRDRDLTSSQVSLRSASLANANRYCVRERCRHEVGADRLFPIFAFIGVLAEQPVAGKELRIRHYSLQSANEVAYVGWITDGSEV